MITSDNYLILEELNSIYKISEKLCIIKLNLIEYQELLAEFIKLNKNTTFWAATCDFSKRNILAASKLGIKNVIQFPIKKELINNFFNSETPNQTTLENCFNYKPLKSSKVLIVDDNEMNISLLEEILSDIGTSIVSLTDSCEAVELVQKSTFDLCLLDILMPELSGFELAEIIKNSDKNKNTPIIFISAVSGNENIMNGYSLGAYSYIEKPFSPSIVKAQIYNILKSAEEQNEQDKLKENFVASLTHDLKSPINAEICALKQLITKNSDFQNSKNEILAELLNSAQYMKLITDKILCHYKQKNNKISLKKESINMYEFVLSCIEEIKFLCEDKNVKIRFQSDIENVFVQVDKIEIKRVINNLFANAIEYSHRDGFVDINLKRDCNNIIFAIKDYGFGIDLTAHKSVFDEYMSLSKEYKKIGFGLGLNICKAIINEHKGDISIESIPDKGTTVYFTLPLNLSDNVPNS